MQRTLPFRVTQASLNQTAFDFPRNLRNIYAAIDKAVADGSNLLSLEELTLTGYDAGDDFQKTDNRQIAALLQDIARYAYAQSPSLIISIGHPYFLARKNSPAGPDSGERRKSALFNRINLPFNVQSLLGQGRILGMTAKQYLFNHERGYEKRNFAEWSNDEANRLGGYLGTIMITAPGQKARIPFGRPVLQLQSPAGNINLTQVVCEDKWVASRYDDPHGSDAFYARDGVIPAITKLFGRDGLVVAIPNASPPAALKIDKHIHLNHIASRYADTVIDTDGLGSSGSGFAQFGHRMVVQDGKIINAGRRLSFARVATTCSTIKIAAAKKRKAKPHITLPYALPVDAAARQPETLPSWDQPTNPARKIEEMLRMNALWLFDYMRKTKCQGIVEALSGGADSAYNTVIVTLMVRLAIDELGVDGFCREMKHLRYLPHIREAARGGDNEAAIQTCLRHMLTTVYMGTDNNPASARDAARCLIEGGVIDGKNVDGVGGVFIERNIQDIFNSYAMLSAVSDTSRIDPLRKAHILADVVEYLHLIPGSQTLAELDAKKSTLKRRYPEIDGVLISAADPRQSIAYENIQARVRMVIIMMVANVEGKMAIANPNLDEARNANATFGGDLHSGTINLNGFIGKQDEEMPALDYLCRHGLSGFAPIKSLQPVLTAKPSAQLLPKNAAGDIVQSDEGFMQRSYMQMSRMSQLMLQKRIGRYAERRMNPSEIFKQCATETLFRELDDSQLYNQIRLSYERWWSSQVKIHSTPIGPTYGNNVDHQVSLRTPNLSGQDRAALTQLGVSLLFKRARHECTGDKIWGRRAEKKWLTHALKDEDFVDAFEQALKQPATKNQSFNLGALYDRVKCGGMEAVFMAGRPYYEPANGNKSLATAPVA